MTRLFVAAPARANPLADSFAQFRPPAGGAISGAQFLLPTIHSNPRLKFETEHQDSNLFFLFLFIDSSPKWLFLIYWLIYYSLIVISWRRRDCCHLVSNYPTTRFTSDPQQIIEESWQLWNSIDFLSGFFDKIQNGRDKNLSINIVIIILIILQNIYISICYPYW